MFYSFSVLCYAEEGGLMGKIEVLVGRVIQYDMAAKSVVVVF